MNDRDPNRDEDDFPRPSVIGLSGFARRRPGDPAPVECDGKDFLPGGGLFAAAPSGPEFPLSLQGLIGILLAAREGLEVNLQGLGLWIDPVRPALKLPAPVTLGMAAINGSRRSL